MAWAATPPRLFGRASELSTLDDLLDRSATGRAVTVVVSGDAGAGKTHLLRAFAASAEASGARVVWGDCPPLGRTLVPLAPVTDLVRALVDDLGAETVRRRAPGSWPVVVELLPEVGPAAGVDGVDGVEPLARSSGPAIAPGRSLDLLVVLLARVNAGAPLVVVIDDLHWADQSTLDLVALAARRLRDAPVLLAVSYRSDEPAGDDRLPGVLAEMDRGGAERIDVGPLSRDEIERLLVARHGGPVAPPQVDAIFSRSQGFPFYAEELLAASGRGEGVGDLPTTLRGVLLERVRQVSPAARQLLGMVAAAGRRVDHRTLATVAAMDDPLLTDLLRELVDRHLLVHDGTSFGFRHALVQEAVYGELLPGERHRLHQAFAEAIDRARAERGSLDAATAAELAHHWSEFGDAANALRSSAEAGLAAERVFAFAEARLQYERALQLWPQVTGAVEVSPIDLLELQRRTAEAAYLAGDGGRAVAVARSALEAAEATSDPTRSGLLAERLGRYLWAEGDAKAAVAAYEQAVALVPDEPTRDRAWVLAALGQMQVILTRFREAGLHSQRAIETAQKVGARREEGHALSTLGLVLVCGGETDEGVAILRRARRIAEELEHGDDLVRADYNLSAVLRGSGRLDDAVTVALEGAAVAAGLGLSAAYGAFLVANAAEALFYAGRWAEARHHIESALPDGGLAMGTRNLHQVGAMLSTAEGRFEEAHRHLDAALTAVGTRNSQPHGALYPVLSDLALWQGRTDDGRRWSAAALASLESSEDTPLLARAAALGLRALADRAAGSDSAPQGEIDALSRVLRRLPPTSQLAVSARPWKAVGLAERARAMGASDPERWSEAAAMWDELGYRYYAACARWREAEARLARRGSRTDGATVLRATHRAATELGAVPLRDALTGLAARSGIDLTADATRDAGLTRRELEVLGLVAGGLTNRQIAGRLNISEKTAGAHVSHILAKLGVRTRAAAAAAALRLGVPTP